ncbi:ATP-binding protein [Bradyrhizobium sp. Pa8]|uniref:ATP-binding protein n=1 Tax=Bradyrhizobium sp. Pa8 TaxID=3386552 RepID=UPI00403F6F35
MHAARRPPGTNQAVLYTRLPRLIEELDVARDDGRRASRMKSIAAVDFHILDDWGRQAIDANARHYLLEIFEDGYGSRSTHVTSQLPIAKWTLMPYLIACGQFEPERPVSFAGCSLGFHRGALV